MECVLLWLDELDDYLSMSAHGLMCVRLHCLRIGLAAALLLPLLEAARASVLPSAFATLAAASVLVWIGAAAAELVAGLRRRRAG